MTCRTLSRWIVAGLLTLSASGRLYGQDAFCGPACDFDLQWFAPVDFDYDCNARRDSCGYFFHFDKLSWAMTGERTTIGQRGLSVPSENIFPNNPFSQGTPVPTYTVHNGIQEAPPDGDFGWGERYEFGYHNGGCGWAVGILDGPRVNSDKIYGFQAITIPNTLPTDSQIDPNFEEPLSLILPSVILPGLVFDDDFEGVFFRAFTGIGQGGPGSADLSTSRHGFGSVHVNFETPEGYLRGIRDYSGTGPIPGPTIYGPGRVLIVTEATFETVNNQVSLRISDAQLFRGGDGVPDNIDGDDNAFFVFDAEGNFLGAGIDFDDFHTFNIVFDTLRVHNSTETNGVEIMKTHQLDNNHKMAKHQNNRFEIGYGARFLKLRDNFYWEGDGGILGRTFADTTADNQIVGPQIQGSWNQQRGRWNFAVSGRCLFGYNIQDLSQIAAVGEDLTPGALNRPANAQPTFSSHGAQENEFSPVAELRVEAAYQISSVFAAKLGYTGLFIDNISRASEIVQYRLPDMGIRQGGGDQEIFVNGVNVGFEASY